MKKIDTNERFIYVLNGYSHSFNFNYLLGIKLDELKSGIFSIKLIFIDGKELEMYVGYDEFILTDYTEDQYVKLPHNETREKYIEITKKEVIKYYDYLIGEWKNKKELCTLNDFILYNGNKINFTINGF